MTRQPLHPPLAHRPAGNVHNPATPPLPENTDPIPTSGPQFGEPTASPDPTKFVIRHGSDAQAYSILDREKGSLKPRTFPTVEDVEPSMKLADAVGAEGEKVEAEIAAAGQIVFHALGDTGNTRGA